MPTFSEPRFSPSTFFGAISASQSDEASSTHRGILDGELDRPASDPFAINVHGDRGGKDKTFDQGIPAPHLYSGSAAVPLKAPHTSMCPHFCISVSCKPWRHREAEGKRKRVFECRQHRHGLA